MRPAAGVWCSLCWREKGHRCQAQIFVDAEGALTGEPGTVALCLPCADGDPCVVDRVGGAPDPAAEEILFEPVESHVPVAPVIHRTAAELGLPAVLPPDPEDARTKGDTLAARREAGKLHSAVEARAKIASRLPQVKVISGERVSMTPGVVMGPELLDLKKEKAMEAVGKRKRGAKVPEDVKEAIYRENVETSHAKLARKYGITDVTVRQIRLKAGIVADDGRRKPQDGGAKREAKPPKQRSSALATLRPGQRGIEIGAGTTAAVDALLPEEVTFEVRMTLPEARRRMEQLTPAQVAIALRAVMQAGLQG